MLGSICGTLSKMSDRVQEARDRIVLSFGGEGYTSLEEVEAELDALITSVRAERVEVTDEMVEAGACAMAAAAGADWSKLERPSRLLFLSDARVAITAAMKAR